MAYATQAQLEARVSAYVVRRILDDNGDGTTDAAVLSQLLDEATSYVDGFLRAVYPLPLTTVPNELVRLTLDIASAYLYQRFPEWAKGRDPFAMMAAARQELMDLRAGKTRLDIVGSPEPPANTGAEVRAGTLEGDAVTTHFFLDGLGDF